MTKFTIFTPTYNRAIYLERCYRSIVNQNFNSLEWLVIDDGSTDGTKDLIDKLINEAKINITYVYQDNAGKQAAWNVAVEKACGQYFIGLDSDDALNDNCLDSVIKDLEIISSDNDIIGLRCLSKKIPSSKTNDKNFSSDLDRVCTWFDEFASGIYQERIDIFKTQILKDYYYPVEKGMKFIPEIWFYSLISKKYKFFYVNKIVRVFYDDDSHNRLSKSAFKKHYKGHLLARKTMLANIPLKYFLKNPSGLLKTLIRYMQARYYNFLFRD